MEQKPYKHQAWPSWRYDPETGEGAIYESESDVPEGHVDSLTKVGLSKKELAAAEKSEKAPKKEEAPAEDKPTLKKLKLSRKQAIEILDDEEVAYAPKASNDEIAALVKDLLEDEDSE